MVMQSLQECSKSDCNTKRYFVHFPHFGHAAIWRFSAVVVRFAVFLWRPCNKNHSYLGHSINSGLESWSGVLEWSGVKIGVKFGVDFGVDFGVKFGVEVGFFSIFFLGH